MSIQTRIKRLAGCLCGATLFAIVSVGPLLGDKQEEAESKNDDDDDTACANVPLPWSGPSVSLLMNTERADFYRVLEHYPARRSCPAAIAYLYKISERNSHEDIDKATAFRLAGLHNFWLATMYLMSHDTSLTGHKFAAAVWRMVRHLPSDCQYESALFDSGGGALLRELFADCGVIARSRLQGILVLPLDTLDDIALDDFWDYFTDYGGDPRTDPIATLDCFAAAFDLRPSYRAKWRKDAELAGLSEEVDGWSDIQQWEFAYDAVALRKADYDKYAKIRSGVLSGSTALDKTLFREK